MKNIIFRIYISHFWAIIVVQIYISHTYILIKKKKNTLCTHVVILMHRIYASDPQLQFTYTDTIHADTKRNDTFAWGCI